MSTQYVQHVSGRGEKWRVARETDTHYFVSQDNAIYFDIPKSEYRPCLPPAPTWVNISTACEASLDVTNAVERSILLDYNYAPARLVARLDLGYRFRKIPAADCQYCAESCTSFIVETET